MKSLWFASFAFFTGGQGQNRNAEVSTTNCTERHVAGGNQDTGGTCRGAFDVAGATEGTMFASMGHYLSESGAFACDEWRGNTTCHSGICFCAEEGVCAVNGQCGGSIGTMTCGGTSNGLPCQFPFEYLGREYTECTQEGTPDDDPYEWCYVAGGVRWGRCNCQDDCADTEGYIDAKGFNCADWEGESCPAARVYGYNSTGIESLLENCPLTCKECFPPALMPGQGDTVVYRVKGSISFTVPASSADEFLSSPDVETALAEAMQEMSGDLSTGVVIDLVTGSDVEGITVFCGLEDCHDGQVLKLSSALPESCAGSACTSEECCTAPATCTAAVCDSATHVAKAGDIECAAAECQQDECCDLRGTCASDVCGATEVLMEETALCALANCTSAECCESKGQCATTPGTTSASPSAGPSAGPAFSEDWSGCPADSHVDKAAGDVPEYCDGARCSIFECCAPRGVCNVTAACDEATHVPKDRHGEPCALEECTQEECCDARDTCQASDCSAITATHAFDSSAGLCWGATCTESECCGVRASCSFAACGTDNANYKRVKAQDSADFLCAGLTCTADECCEWIFDGYKRTTDYLTTAVTDTNPYSTPTDAYNACGADGECDGFTCPTGDDGTSMAVGQCYLRATGTTGDGTVSPNFFVSFVSITCAASDCDPSTEWLLKGDDMPSTCSGSCDTNQCCDARGQCASGQPGTITCPDDYVDDASGLGGARCAGKDCRIDECCAPKDTCQESDCTDGTHIPKVDDLPLYCAGTTCNEAECCDERAQCADEDVCGSTHVLKPPNLPMPFGSSGRCVGIECTLGECCSPRAVCQESICADDHVFEPSVALCAATRCESHECCAPRATCDASACGNTHILLEGNLGAMCETSVCTPDECCTPRGQCSSDVCNTDSYFKDDPPALCEGARCTSEECCLVCPFVGNWQSTSVFGGDNLRIEESGDFDSGYQVTMVMAAAVSFEFVIARTGESLAECQCTIKLDAFTIAAGEMNAEKDRIAWDMILNNDMWIPGADRRLENSERNYEIKDGAITVLPPKRRLQQQDVRMDFEIETASENDMVTLQSALEVMDLMEMEMQLKLKLAETNFTIGSVYMVDNFESESEVILGQRTSGAVRSAFMWTWMLVSTIAALSL